MTMARGYLLVTSIENSNHEILHQNRIDLSYPDYGVVKVDGWPRARRQP